MTGLELTRGEVQQIVNSAEMDLALLLHREQGKVVVANDADYQNSSRAIHIIRSTLNAITEKWPILRNATGPR